MTNNAMAHAVRNPAVIRATITRKRMNPLSWSLNDWYIAFQVVSLVLLAGTVLTGAGALITGNVLSKQLNIALEEQREKTARAEKSAHDALTAAVVPRHFTIEAEKEAKEILRQGPKGRAEIYWTPNNFDAEVFARVIRLILEDGGWSVIKFGPDTGRTQPSGTDVNWRSREAVPPQFESLRRAMMAGWPGCGKFTWSGISGETEDSPIVITVGPKT